jgi:hypothetical protein
MWLRGSDVVALKVGDVAPNGNAVDRATVRQKKTGQPVRFELTERDPGSHRIRWITAWSRYAGRKALYILKDTGDLQTVRTLLGHARIEPRDNLGLKTNIDPIEVCRAFDI